MNEIDSDIKQTIKIDINDVVINEVLVSDCKRIAELEKECFSLPWSADSVVESLNQDCTLFLKAEYEGQIVGYIGLYRFFDEGDITNIAVTSLYRRNNIAKKLIESIIEKCKNLGVHEITLEVRESNIKAISLYEKTGFVDIGIRKDFYEKPIENAKIMRCI